MEIIIGKQGQQPFPITDKGVSRQHLKITPIDDGKYQIEDLNSTNGTFVDGQRIIRKIVSGDTEVQLGASFRAKVSDLIPKSTPKESAKPEQGSYSIKHLESVWNTYHDGLQALKDQNRKIGLLRSVPMAFTMTGGVLATVSKMASWGEGVFALTLILSIVALTIMIYGFYKSATFNFDKESEKLKRDYQEKCVCPNPKCHRYVGNLGEYHLLSQNSACPYCKAKWTK